MHLPLKQILTKNHQA
jgi:hypothetical protein